MSNTLDTADGQKPDNDDNSDKDDGSETDDAACPPVTVLDVDDEQVEPYVDERATWDKHFITVVPLQEPHELTSELYQWADGVRLTNDYETRFPVVAMMKAFCRSDVPTKVTAIVFVNSNENLLTSVSQNMDLLKREIQDICGMTEGTDYTFDTIEIEYGSSQEHLLNLTDNIMEAALGDKVNKRLYVDFTYGEKNIPIALFQVVLELESSWDVEVDIGFCTYGLVQFFENCEDTPLLRGITSLIYHGYRLQDVEAEPDDFSQGRKHFITFLPLAKDINPMLWHVNETLVLNESEATVYSPYSIVALLKNVLVDGEEADLTYVKFESDDNRDIEEVLEQIEVNFRNAIDEAFPNENIRLNRRQIDGNSLSIPYRCEIRDLKKLRNDLLASFDPIDTIYADLTYGYKTNTLILYHALAENILKRPWMQDRTYACYGHVPHQDLGRDSKVMDIGEFIKRDVKDFEIRQYGTAEDDDQDYDEAREDNDMFGGEDDET
ncbi:MAG: hypothetical protein LBD25_03535 [Coriobacteriales bacterium]|nr:hypothetical protein [Coriobacteriales bacterium]